MRERLTIEQRNLLFLLKASLQKPEDKVPELNIDMTRQQWETMLGIARRHAVLPLLYNALEQYHAMPEELFKELQAASRQTVRQSYRLLHMTNYIVKLLEKESIKVLVLKGAATAALYPVFELRKSGDIDLLVAGKEVMGKVQNILEKHGFLLKEKQLAHHHMVFEAKAGIVIEIHTMLAEPFDSQRVNSYLADKLDDYFAHVAETDILGSRLPVPADAYHAFYLLLHMLQHFLRAGFGLKLLCDWVVFWNREIPEQDVKVFSQMTGECGLDGFAEGVTAVCIRYLGLASEKVWFIGKELLPEAEAGKFMAEVMEAEEFGKSNQDRMVVLRGTSPFDYIREFHHQMCLNYPGAKKIHIIWPLLWFNTLARFLYNNRKIRKTSVFAILRKTSSRSENKKAMHLFQMRKRTGGE